MSVFRRAGAPRRMGLALEAVGFFMVFLGGTGEGQMGDSGAKSDARRKSARVEPVALPSISGAPRHCRRSPAPMARQTMLKLVCPEGRRAGGGRSAAENG